MTARAPRALLLDVDNTLTGLDKTFALETQQALRELITSQKFRQVGVCTGKGWSALYTTILPAFPPDSLHITSSGAEIVTQTGEIRWQKLLPLEVVRELLSELVKAEAAVLVNQPDAIYGAPAALERLMTHPYHFPVRPLTELTDLSRVSYLGIYRTTPTTVAVLENWSSEVSWRVADHGKNIGYAEVTAPGVHKGVGLMEWCRLTGINAEDIIGIGDSTNDLEWLELVGTAVAMGNSSSEVKAVAHQVIGHTDELGLAHFLRQL